MVYDGQCGRTEQFMLTDYDRFLVYSDREPSEQVEVELYFEKLGSEIVRHLEAAGYKRCPDLMMTSEAQW